MYLSLAFSALTSSFLVEVAQEAHCLNFQNEASAYVGCDSGQLQETRQPTGRRHLRRLATRNGIRL